MEESPKYLVQKKKRELAVSALRGVNRFRRKKVRAAGQKDLQLALSEMEQIVDNATGRLAEAEKLVDKDEEEEPSKKGKKKYTFVHLYKTPQLAIRTLVGSFSLSVVFFFRPHHQVCRLAGHVRASLQSALSARKYLYKSRHLWSSPMDRGSDGESLLFHEAGADGHS